MPSPTPPVARARTVGAIEGLGQAFELGLVDAGAVVADLDLHALRRPVDHGAQRHAGRAGRIGAVAQGVVQQVAHQQADAHAVDGVRRQSLGQVQVHLRGARHLGRHLAHQRRQVDRLALQRHVRACEPLALEQVADQVAHLVQVAQQRLALGLAFGRGRQQLGIEPGARER